MALSLKVPFDHAAIAQSDHGVKLPGATAFSFWKLPEQWRPALESTIGPSEAAAERLLLEQYLPEIDRHPPSAMRAYYCVKGLIPQALRHRLNSVAIRARKPLRFPSWPCESALVEFWRAWLNRVWKSRARRTHGTSAFGRRAQSAASCSPTTWKAPRVSIEWS